MKLSRFKYIKIKDIARIAVLLGGFYLTYLYFCANEKSIKTQPDYLQTKINTQNKKADLNNDPNDIDNNLSKDQKNARVLPNIDIGVDRGNKKNRAAKHRGNGEDRDEEDRGNGENRAEEDRRKHEDTQNLGGEMTDGRFQSEMLNVTNPFDLKVHPPYLDGYRNPCWLEEGGRVRCLPYFLLIGMMKCGTTDLYQRLMVHPRVIAPSNRRWEVEKAKLKFDENEREWRTVRWKYKEPHYWAGHWKSGRTLADYVSLFDKAAEEINTTLMRNPKTGELYHAIVTFDASTSTFWDNKFWELNPDNAGLTEPNYLNPHYIRHVLPDVKLILSLRNPVDRLYSEYKFLRRTGVEHAQKKSASPQRFHETVMSSLEQWKLCLHEKSFKRCLYTSEYMKYCVHRGLYAHLLAPWLEVFPREQIAIIKFEEYVKDTLGKLKGIYKFLKIDALPVQLENVVLNYPVENEIQDKAPMLNKTRHLLEEFYRPYNKQLATLLGDDRFLWEEK